MENKEERPLFMTFRILGNYLKILSIEILIVLILLLLFNVLMDISLLIGNKGIISILIVSFTLFFLRLYAWMMSIKSSFKGRYVNSLLLNRIFISIAALIVCSVTIFFIFAHLTNISPNNLEAHDITNKISLLPNTELGQTQKEVYEMKLKEINEQNDYTIYIQIGNILGSFALLPIIWLGLKDIDDRNRK